MKFLVFTDLHIGYYGDRTGNRLKNTIDCLNYILQYAYHNNYEALLFCGDLFDRESYLKVETVNAASKYLNSIKNVYNDIPVYCINGNHDFCTINTGKDNVSNSSLEFALNTLENWHDVGGKSKHISGGYKDIYVHGINYHTYKKDFDEALNETIKNIESINYNILMIHQTPTNIENALIEPEIDTQDERLKNFDLVLCGHIHKREHIKQSVTNFYVVGSPLHRDKGDLDQSKGFYACDVSDINKPKIEFIPIDIFPEYRSPERAREFDKPYIKPVQVAKALGLTLDQSKYDVANREPLHIMEAYVNEVKHERNSDQLLKIAIEINNKIK